MNKKHVIIVALFLAIAVCAFVACSSTNDYKGTYYEYDKNGNKTDDRIELEKDKWSSSDGESGRLEVKDGAVTAYCEFSGEEDVFFTGTVGDGVLTYSLVEGVEYKAYKDGAYKNNSSNATETTDTDTDTADTDTDNKDIAPGTGKLEYTVASDNGYCAITGPGEYSGTDLVIPSSIDGVPVTYIKANAFKGKQYAKITIPGSVQYIELSAFQDCASLTSLTLENGIKTIASNAFKGCTALTEVVVPSSVQTISSGAFSGCTALESVNVENGSDEAEELRIGETAFAYSGLKSFTVPNSVTEIKDGTFRNNDNLVSVDLGDNVTTIGKYVLTECSSLTDVYIGKSATLLDDYFLSDGNRQKTIHFKGTKEEWNDINKRAYWKTAAGELTIECTDGTITNKSSTEGSDPTDSTKKTYTRVNGAGEQDSAGKYIYFGSYPQTKVTDETLISALTDYAGTLPTSSNFVNWTSYGYFINGSVSDYMWYKDKEYDGEKYRGIYFTSYRPYWCNGSSSASNGNQADNGYYTSDVYWFKYEPVKWIILTESGGKALILADLAIDGQQYYNNYSSRTIDGKTVYANNYAESDIRKWLNDTFYNTAFTSLQKELIQTTSVDNSVESTGYDSNDYACENTNDNVFLLSYKEVTTYLPSNTVRQMKSSDYAKSQGCWTSTSSGYEGNCCWWLRSPSNNAAGGARRVGNGGYVGRDYYVYSAYRGVLPALTISLS